MRNKIPAIFTFLFLLLFAVGWVAYSLKQPLNTFKSPFAESEQSISNDLSSTQVDQAWVESMSNQMQKMHSYPVSEMTLKYNFDRGVEPLHVFVEDLNEYRFYCINQLLLEEKVEYAYYKTAKAIQLIVFLENEAMKDRILADFDYYKIPYSF